MFRHQGKSLGFVKTSISIFLVIKLKFINKVEPYRTKDQLLTTYLPNGDKLIHTAIDTHNFEVVRRLLRLSNGDEWDAIYHKGLSAFELAKLRDNKWIIELVDLDVDQLDSVRFDDISTLKK